MRKNSALTALKGGTDIGAVAKQYTDDAASATSGGGLSIHGKDLAGVPSLKPSIDALAQPGASSPDFTRADDGFYFFKLVSRDAPTDLIKMQYVYIYDPKPELYSTTRRPKWLMDMITGLGKAAHVKYNVGSKAS